MDANGTEPGIAGTRLAVDSHAHVFCGDLPFAPGRVYTPEPCQAGTARQFRAVLDAHGITHGLLVGAQPYDTDNRCLLRSIAQSGGRFRGIALVPAGATPRELRDLADGGVVGIRINLTTDGMRGLVEPGAERLLAQVREMGWFVQVHCEHDELAEAAPILRRAGVRAMIDHLGRPHAARGTAQPGFRALLELGREGTAVCKVSGPFRSSVEGHPWRDVDPFVEAVLEAFTPDRCVWGSDWPFVRMDERVDYGPALAWLRRVVPDEARREKLLWSTPARLFGFASPA